jgi:hypothetical protein
MEISDGRVDLDSSDSIGPSNILKKIREEKSRKYEEHRLAQASKLHFVSRLLRKKLKRTEILKAEEQSEKRTKSLGNLKTQETVTRTIIYSSDIKGLTQDLDHVSIETLTHICKIIQDALIYLDALDTLEPAFGKNSDCRAC